MLALFLMLFDGVHVCFYLCGGRNQWDHSLKAVTKLDGMCDVKKYKFLVFLGKSFTALNCLRRRRLV
jgi:hypothetical protein